MNIPGSCSCGLESVRGRDSKRQNSKKFKQSLNLEQNKVISFPKFCLTLGDASYTLYLIHFPMMLLMNKLPQIMGYTITANQEVLYSYFIIICIIIASIFVHKWIEKPLAKRLSMILNS